MGKATQNKSGIEEVKRMWFERFNLGISTYYNSGRICYGPGSRIEWEGNAKLINIILTQRRETGLKMLIGSPRLSFT